MMKRKIGIRHGWVLNPGRQGHMRRLKNNSQTCLRLESIPGSQDHMQRLRKIVHKPYQAGIELATHWFQARAKTQPFQLKGELREKSKTRTP